MCLKLKFALYVGIPLCLVLSHCHVSAEQNLYELSYGQDVAPQITPQPPTTTTKSSFFKGIKKWFKSDSSTSTTTPSTIQLNSGNNGAIGPIQQPQPKPISTPAPPFRGPTSNAPNQKPDLSRGPSSSDFEKSNVRPGSPPVSPLPITPSPPIAGQAPNRDFVNTNVRPGSSSIPPIPVTPASAMSGVTPPTARPISGISPSQNPNNRDYVSPVKPGNIPINPVTPVAGNPNIGPQPQTPTNRDYVNPNVRPSTIPVNPQSGSPILPNNGNQGQGFLPMSSNIPNNPGPTQPTAVRRDFVNTTPRGQPLQPSINRQPSPNSSPIPQSGNPWGTSPQQPPSDRRDFVNPNRPQQNKEEFPPLPTPRNPATPPHQPTRPGSGVSFVPRQPSSPGRGSATRSPELATDDELATLTETLFTKDTNNQNGRIVIDYQGKTRSSDRSDEASKPLLQVNAEALESPTIAKIRPLFNNYELDTTVNEHVTPLERREENELLDAILATSVMRQAMLFLQDKGVVTPDPKTHRDLLKTIWFTLYSRGGGRIGSSSFEHIFLSEIKNGTISGLHNWIYYFEEERLGHIDYKGYIKKLELGNKGAIVKFRFNFNGIEKPVNSMFVGTSPELEMALYTVCFEVRPDKECPISVNGNKFTIQTYSFRYRGKRLIGSAFPEI